MSAQEKCRSQEHALLVPETNSADSRVRAQYILDRSGSTIKHPLTVLLSPLEKEIR